MGLRIKANSLLFQSSLEVGEGWVTIVDDGPRQFLIPEIVCVLLSEKNVLSFQVGWEVFSIRVKPGNVQHRRVMDYLVAQAARAGAAQAT